MSIFGGFFNKFKVRLQTFTILMRNTGIHKSTRFKCPQFIDFGDNCRIGENSYLLCWDNYEFSNINQTLSPCLKIGDNFSATRDLTIQCCNRIDIGNDVLIASNVFICDYNHGTKNIFGSYLNNELVLGEVIIDDGVWIGQGAYILPNVHIGKKSIIGAGSVVTKDVPSYCVVAGNPAKVIRRIDSNK